MESNDFIFFALISGEKNNKECGRYKKMKIKLAILERDTSYLNRIVSVFNTKYTDKFEVYSFTNLEVALDYLETAKRTLNKKQLAITILTKRSNKVKRV